MEDFTTIDWADVQLLATTLANRLSIIYGRPSTMDVEDLVQIGVLAALEALPRFDPTIGTRFQVFVFCRIRGAMLDAMCKELKAPRVGLSRCIEGVTPSTELTDLKLAFDELPAFHRRVLETFLAGVDLRRIARARRVSYHHVRHSYHDAVDFLRHRLTFRPAAAPPRRRRMAKAA